MEILFTFCVLGFARSIFLDNELIWICMTILGTLVGYKRRELSNLEGTVR